MRLDEILVGFEAQIDTLEKGLGYLDIVHEILRRMGWRLYVLEGIEDKPEQYIPKGPAKSLTPGIYALLPSVSDPTNPQSVEYEGSYLETQFQVEPVVSYRKGTKYTDVYFGVLVFGTDGVIVLGKNKMIEPLRYPDFIDMLQTLPDISSLPQSNGTPRP